VWSAGPELSHVDAAVDAARAAFPAWARLARDRRSAVLRRFQEICKARQNEMAGIICDEVGKVIWESMGEATALSSKVDITLETDETGGLKRVAGYEFRPHGVMCVLGPFNFPAHLPNGHIVPALAMGNTVVFKPSDKAPGVGQLLAEFFQEAIEAEVGGELPGRGGGVFNLVHGGAPIAQALVAHDRIDGILFTGSWPVGRSILHANLDNPGRIVALEMGGNNAAVVMPDADLHQAAIEITRCAFNTTGQRCTSTRRAIVHRDIADRIIPAICKAASNLIIGDPRAKHPVFMGPIINAAAREACLRFQADLRSAGGEVLVEASAPQRIGVEGELEDGFYVTPSVVRVDRFTTSNQGPGKDAGCDVELFGPQLRISVVSSLDAAIEQANASRYGLAASIFTSDQKSADRFLFEARAGCLNVNTGTAGASSRLPFGGLGHSGNHRPAGSFSLDYCAYPVGAMIESGSAAQIPDGMRFDAAWLK
jgi:succinylglutamic semialdehyde dehydrogenase